MDEKLRKIQQKLKQDNLDFLFLFNSGLSSIDPNFYYLTGFNLEYAIVLVPKVGKPSVFVPVLEYERVKRRLTNFKVIKFDKKNMFEPIGKLLKRKKVAFNAGIVSVKQFRFIRKKIKTKWKDYSSTLTQIRQIKTDEEKKIIQKSCDISSSILENLFEELKADAKRKKKIFSTELDIANYLKFQSMTRGCKLAYEPIVATGAASSMPHSTPKDSPIKKGFCIIDFGVKYKGYCSDITRTIYFGKPSGKEIEMYNLFLDVQKKAIAEIKIGMTVKKLSEKVNKNLGKYQDKFIHSLGHGIGVEIHEMPNLSLKSKDRFAEGMIFTVEPGIYFAGKFGIRIEDDILVEEGKVIVLTKLNKQFISI